MMKCRYKKYFSGLIGEFCAEAGLEFNTQQTDINVV